MLNVVRGSNIIYWSRFFFDIAWKPLALNTVLIEKALSSDPNSNSLEGLTLGIVQQ